MKTLYPSCYMANSSRFAHESYQAEWTKEENKSFESALAIYDENTPNRWQKVASMIPGKTEWDVIQQYKELIDDVSEIEAGRVPIPGYPASSFTLELVDTRNYDGCRKSSMASKGAEGERKKGVPWTIDEHRLFLMGLLKYGKGDWRNISRNFVVTKTPIQVASHAQKYFIRQHAGGKDKRRPSIHDITIVNLTDDLPSENNKTPAMDEPYVVLTRERLNDTSKVILNWNHPDAGKLVFFNGSLSLSHSCDIISDEIKLQGKDLYDGACHGTDMKPQNSIFEVHSSGHRVHG